MAVKLILNPTINFVDNASEKLSNIAKKMGSIPINKEVASLRKRADNIPDKIIDILGQFNFSDKFIKGIMLSEDNYKALGYWFHCHCPVTDKDALRKDYLEFYGHRIYIAKDCKDTIRIVV